MKENLDQSTTWITSDEEEGGLVIRAGEPGGAANFGISMQTLIEEWRRLGKGPGRPTLDDLKKLTRDEAKAIYAGPQFAQAIGFNDLPAGLDHAMLEACVNEGVHGAQTFFADAQAISSDIKTQILALSKLRLAAKRMRPQWHDHLGDDGKMTHGFAAGWTKRIWVLIPQRAFSLMEPKP